MKDGRVAMGFQIGSQEMEKLPANGYQSLADYWVGACKTLPVGATVQKLDFYYYQPYRINCADKTFFERSTINHFYNRLVLQHRSYLFLSVGNSRQPESNPVNTLFAWGKPFGMSNPFEGIEERMETLPRLAREFTGLLQTAGISAQVLDEEGLSEVYRMYFNLEFDPVPNSFQRPFHASDHYAVLGEKKLNVVSMLHQAGIVEPAVSNYTGVASPFIYPLTHYLQMPHILSVSATVLDTEKTLEALDSENELNRFMDFLSTQDNVKKTEEITAFTQEICTQNERILHPNVSVTVWHSDDQVPPSYVH